MATTIAATSTSHYVDGHPGVSPASGAALTHGFEITFYVLAAMMLLAALCSAVVIESRPTTPAESEADNDAREVVLEVAA